MIRSPVEKWIRLMEFGRRMGCHQMPERSFFFKGYQFPVCARCTGVIIGQAVALIVAVCGVVPGWGIDLAMLVPMGLDWGLQFLGILSSGNIRRVVTGVLGGAGLCYLYIHVFRWLFAFVANVFC